MPGAGLRGFQVCQERHCDPEVSAAYRSPIRRGQPSLEGYDLRARILLVRTRSRTPSAAEGGLFEPDAVLMAPNLFGNRNDGANFDLIN
jgi:hypothetical protein